MGDSQRKVENQALGGQYMEWGYKETDTMEGLEVYTKKDQNGRTCVRAC